MLALLPLLSQEKKKTKEGPGTWGDGSVGKIPVGKASRRDTSNLAVGQGP